MKKIVVIGSDSFIAGKFINSIQNQYSLRLFTRQLSDKFDEILKYDLMDITSEDMKGADIVINFAAIVHKKKIKDEKLYKRVNAELPIHLAMQAKLAGISLFIQISTVAVFGNKKFIDEHTIESPNSIYGQTKLLADRTLLTLNKDSFRVLIIRPPMVYGGGNAPGNMLKLFNTIRRGIPLPFKDVNNRKHFINVHNLVGFINYAIQNNLSGIFIPTDKNTISIEDLVKSIAIILDKRIVLFSFPKFIIDIIKRVFPDIYGKLFESIYIKDKNYIASGFKPSHTIEEGLKGMI